MVNVFRLKKKQKNWQRIVGKAATTATENGAVRAAASTLAGITALTAVSAAVSSARRKSQS
jgi:hypothetical protein